VNCASGVNIHELPTFKEKIKTLIDKDGPGMTIKQITARVVGVLNVPGIARSAVEEDVLDLLDEGHVSKIGKSMDGRWRYLQVEREEGASSVYRKGLRQLIAKGMAR